MGEMWRSQEMQLIQMIVQNDAAHEVVEKLGELGIVEFRDLNVGTTFYKRSFVEEVRKCDDLDRILRELLEDLEVNHITIPESDAISLTLDELEPKVKEAELEAKNLKSMQELFLRNHNSLKEQKLVLQLGKKIYDKSTLKHQRPSSSGTADVPAELMALSEFAGTSSSLLGQVSGVVKSSQIASLERVIFRATRGNAVFEQASIDEPLLEPDSKNASESFKKSFFMVLFAGEVMRDKIQKICTYFGAGLYKFPENVAEHLEMWEEVGRRMTESTEVFTRTQQVMTDFLTKIAGDYSGWSYTVKKEKMVFDALNMCEFDIKRHVFVAEGWVPKSKCGQVVHALTDAAIACGLDTRPIINKLSSNLTPPTHIPVTPFTSGFQALVNTYGTPRYREANPGAFCCIFFPFLFGIMFGDFGHGTLLALFGYWLISKEKEWAGKPLNDMVEMCFGGRYVILLNGLFGAYVGLLYNEAFAFPMNWFGGTRWMDRDDPTVACHADAHNGCIMPDGPYPIGIDPIWHYVDNKITFFNSFKMKISIVVGVIQMSVGIFLSLLNHLEYRDYKKVFFQFIPEILFFEGIFGYLVFAIFYKWSINWNDPLDPKPAPSLLTLLIDMFMSPNADIKDPLYAGMCFTDCAVASDYCDHAVIAKACPMTCMGEGIDRLAPLPNEYKQCFSDTQSSIQMTLLAMAFVAVPFLLFPIPFIQLYQYTRSTKLYSSLHDGEEKESGGGGGGSDHGEEFSFGDAFIHQAIHTIEFVLGSISNTASYLRLWALSLAHSQLAELFKDMILTDVGLKLGLNPLMQGIVAFLAFGMWAVISLVVLMVMENLSSFLHALRLQWVEFQNKFFYGDGQKYTPFNFATINAEVSEE